MVDRPGRGWVGRSTRHRGPRAGWGKSGRSSGRGAAGKGGASRSFLARWAPPQIGVVTGLSAGIGAAAQPGVSRETASRGNGDNGSRHRRAPMTTRGAIRVGQTRVFEVSPSQNRRRPGHRVSRETSLSATWNPQSRSCCGIVYYHPEAQQTIHRTLGLGSSQCQRRGRLCVYRLSFCSLRAFRLSF